jgi:hypothetical protein
MCFAFFLLEYCTANLDLAALVLSTHLATPHNSIMLWDYDDLHTIHRQNQKSRPATKDDCCTQGLLASFVGLIP